MGGGNITDIVEIDLILYSQFNPVAIFLVLKLPCDL